MEMVAFFAATALLLAGLGIYGTISYVVNEQRREIAIRLAFGAERGNILKMAAPGTRSGGRWRRAGCGRSAHRLSPHGRTALRRVAYRSAHLRGRHPCTYHVALAASCIPALRAMRLDPITAVHSE
jgi:hypothetical protein